MKKNTIIALAAALLATSVPAFAATHHMTGNAQQDEQCLKDCQMLVRDCGQEVDSIQQQIKKLKTALNENSGKYTAAQLSVLKNRLESAQKTLRVLERGGA